MPLVGKNLEQCRDYLEKGWILAYPTETCYGLGVNPLNEDAVKDLNILKNRTNKASYILLVKDLEMLERYAELGNNKKLLSMLWPEPVSVVLKATNKVPSWIFDKDGNTCFRISSSKFVKELFEYLDRPLISTSANPNNFQVAIDAVEVMAYFQNHEKILIMNDLYSDISGTVPTTILDLTKEPVKILRKGAFNIVF